MFLRRMYSLREKSPDRIFQVLPEKGALKKVPFRLVLDFCLNAYDKIEFNTFPLSENYTMILLMPNKNCDTLGNTRVHEIISGLKNAISTGITKRKANISRLIENVQVPQEAHPHGSN